MAARWVAALVCFMYGFAKISGSQFTVLDSELTRPLGEVSGFWLTWHYFGYSAAYGNGIASLQILAGVLLVLPRTALAGALLLLPVVVNIVLIDIFYGVDAGGTAMAMMLLLAILAVISPYRRRLRSAVLLQTQPAWPGTGALVALGLALAGAWGFTSWIANVNTRAPTVIDGVWSVASQGGSPAGAPLWRHVFFERHRAHLVVMRADGQADRRHHFEVDPSGTVRIWRDWLAKGPLLMQGRRRSDSEIELDSVGGHDAGQLVLQRVESSR